jgi:hypothetical protein
VKLRNHLPPFFEAFPPLARCDLFAAGVGLPLFIFSCACWLEGALIPLLPLNEDSFLAGIKTSFGFVADDQQKPSLAANHTISHNLKNIFCCGGLIRALCCPVSVCKGRSRERTEEGE